MRKTLAPVRPSPAIGAEYRRRLERLIDEMGRSVAHGVKVEYRKNPPEVAHDELPSAAMSAAMRRLAARWQRRFDDLARDMARHFATDVAKRSDAVLRRALAKGGMSVEFKMTRGMRDVLGATVHENASLIRSIPASYLSKVEGAVMRSVQTGRDLKQLSDDLRREFGVTRRRAALISRDQNNKATAALQRVRQQELGIKQAVWVHSGGGKTPRPSHLRAGRDKVVFDLETGWWDPDEKEWVLPGQLVNCRCVSRPVIPGFG